MNKKIKVLEFLKAMLTQPKQKQCYYTMREKREMAARGECVPVCYSLQKGEKSGIVPLRHVPNEEIKRLKFKI